MKQGRSYRNRFYRGSHMTRPQPAARGRFDDQRNMDGRVVNKESMLALAVLSQRLTMITHKDDQARVVQPVALQPCDEPPQFMIGIRDFTVIKVVAILRTEGLRWLIGTVRIVKV